MKISYSFFLITILFFVYLARNPLSRFSISFGLGDAKSALSHLGIGGMMIVDFLSALLANAKRQVDTLPLVEGTGHDQLETYIAYCPPKEKNDYTGRFKGYNVIYITAESFSHLAIRPDLTPTLYKMQTQGIHFTQCYNPLWGVSTLDGEYISTTGLLPKAGVWSQLKARNNALPFTLGNAMKREGIPAFAYHNNDYAYYRRDLTHPNMGYKYKGLNGGLDLMPDFPQSDLEMIQKSLPEYIGMERFMVYYMTVSGHLPYVPSQNAQVRQHWDEVKHLPFSKPARAYLATQLELEAALTHLLSHTPPNTLFSLVSDHYPYGLNKKQHAELLGRPLNGRFELYRNAMLIYAPGMKPQTVDEPVYSADLLPTLLNLLDLPYDARPLSGRDIFSSTPPLVPFSDRSFITDRGQYDSWTRKFTPFSPFEEDGYVTRTLETVNAKFSAAARILDYDFLNG